MKGIDDRRGLPRPNPWHFVALLGGNFALALGPWFVRMADSGPVSAGFWRLFLPLPVLAILAVRQRGPVRAVAPLSAWLLIAIAGVAFALDLASWHIGIAYTRLGNASLFGNSGSLILMVWGLIAARRLPRPIELAAIVAAISGAAILLGRSLEIDHVTLIGDLFCILAGVFYFFYIMLLQGARDRFESWELLFTSTLASAPVMLAIALWLGEPVWPHVWWPLVALAFCSQVVGQGLIVFALRHFSALIIGVVLLTQPAVSILIGWLVFGETMGPLDAIGMALIAAALLLGRLGETKSR
ncbi:MAG: DMT family transporter [Sphingomonadales bacterium]|uniref:DMT family transporter n=1 Tax=unclassified Novosphingobium TaxID=2644732 RepID=UPI0006B940B0|nr:MULTISPECIES: DMT family transporter [unclassified Novosphingobium]KPF81544.1 permease [Novosphingobium sp. AAP93]MBU6394257.1 DMT family transporter [Sphingomonadales bacterium]